MWNKITSKDNARDRICVVRHGYYPTDVRVLKEAHTLCQAGYAVDVVCLRNKGQKKREYLDGVQIYRLGVEHRRGSLLRYAYEYSISFLMIFLNVTALFFKHRYKCIQVNTMPDVLVFVTIIPRLFGAKVLLDMHEPAPELFVTKYGQNKYRWAVKLIAFAEQISLKYATAVLAVNESIKQKYIERGACSHKMHVVRNVPEKDVLTEGPVQSEDGRFNLIIHGLISERYGHETVIRAVAMLRDRIKNVHLMIAGLGDNEQRMQQLTKELDCSDIVTFHGWVPAEQISGLIASADVGLAPLLPSPFAELCQPNKLFELVSGKRPVIASRLMAIEESFDDSCIMFFEPGNAEELAQCIIDLYLNPEKRRLLSQNAYRRYETISWKENKKTYLRVIDSLFGKEPNCSGQSEEAQEIHSDELCDATNSVQCKVG